MTDLEVTLVKGFGWSLFEIDQTDIESLIPFVMTFAGKVEGNGAETIVYADQVDWL